MSRVQKYLVKANWMLAMSLLLSSAVISRSTERAATVSAGTCTSQTGLHCEVYGKEDGDPILALHGLGSSIYTWRKLNESPYPFQNYRLILVDLRGAGKSPKPHDKHYSILEQADLIYQFILEKNLKNLTLMGNSYGGAVSLLVAIKLCETDPGRFSKLILIDSGGYDKKLPGHLKLLRTPILGLLVLYILPPKTSSRMILKKGYYDEKKITEEQVEAYAAPIAAKGGRYALYQTARQAIPKNIDEITSKYKTIRVPTLILWGLQDKIIPLEIGEQLRSDIPNSKLEIIDKAGHMPQEEVPERVIPLILEFMKKPPS
jgi:pimeloyl-ACP methyl ester carboxylesterase